MPLPFPHCSSLSKPSDPAELGVRGQTGSPRHPFCAFQIEPNLTAEALGKFLSGKTGYRCRNLRSREPRVDSGADWTAPKKALFLMVPHQPRSCGPQCSEQQG